MPSHAAVAVAALLSVVAPQKRAPDIHFTPTRHNIADAMLRLARVTPDDVVYDLGSGDGKIVIMAAQKFGARGVGVDINPERIKEANANAKTAKAVRRAFSYIWSESQIGGGKPQLELHEAEERFTHDGVEITPLPVLHGDWTILGYRVGNFAYITDTNGIPPATLRLLKGVEVLALDGLRPSPPHPTISSIG